MSLRETAGMEDIPVPQSEEGAVLTDDGYALLGKLLASKGGLKYTKAELDKGQLPEGQAPEQLHGPCEYAGDGFIASIENTGTGEATVVVQATSIGVAVGFHITGVSLYAEDPETGEDVHYAYLPLQEHPEWMRPEGSPVNKMCTFNLVTIVSGVEQVIANISPEALARKVDLEKYALIGHSHVIDDVTGLRGILDDHQAGIDLLNDLVSGDMPGGINKTADFATLAGITIRDGLWNKDARSITA